MHIEIVCVVIGCEEVKFLKKKIYCHVSRQKAREKLENERKKPRRTGWGWGIRRGGWGRGRLEEGEVEMEGEKGGERGANVSGLGGGGGDRPEKSGKRRETCGGKRGGTEGRRGIESGKKERNKTGREKRGEERGKGGREYGERRGDRKKNRKKRGIEERYVTGRGWGDSRIPTSTPITR